jgi:hypothetical protein
MGVTNPTKRKYIGSHAFLADLVAAKKYFFSYVLFCIKDGLEIRFRENKWLGNASVQE